MQEGYRRMALAFQSMKSKTPSAMPDKRALNKCKLEMVGYKNFFMSTKQNSPLKIQRKLTSIRHTHDEHNSSILSDNSEAVPIRSAVYVSSVRVSKGAQPKKFRNAK
jgi:hypothetical protein